MASALVLSHVDTISVYTSLVCSHDCAHRRVCAVRRYLQFAALGAKDVSAEEMDSQNFKIFCQQLFPAGFPATQA